MVKIMFTIPGEPIGKARPRVVRQGNRVHTFTPQKTVDYEQVVRLAYQSKYRNISFTDEPVKVLVTAYMSIPKSISKKKREKMLSGEIRPTKKPDWDNIGKVITDALNGIAYADDKQVVCGCVSKYYSDIPHTDVQICEVYDE